MFSNPDTMPIKHHTTYKKWKVLYDSTFSKRKIINVVFFDRLSLLQIEIHANLIFCIQHRKKELFEL